jgi:PHD/YefM family antitoxin component YafN of YafNO toxin-antitoxin module
MRNLTADFQPLATFGKQPSVFAKLMKKTQRPLVLTVNGKPELVVQTAEAYQHLLDLAARQKASEGTRQGLEDIREGRSRPAREVFADFEAKRGISI